MTSVENYIFLAFICFAIFIIILNVAFYILRKNNNSIFNYNKKIKEITKKDNTKKEQKTDAKTLIGYKNKLPVYTIDESKHIFICGTTGSGKTVALSNYIKQANYKKYPLLIVDGKGDINKDSLLYITNQLNDRKLYIINMTDINQSSKYNPFKNTTPTICKDMLINLSNWSEEHYKLNTERYLQKVITLIMLKKIPLSFKSIIQYINIKNFITLSLDLSKNNQISKEEHINNIELSNNAGKIAESATARFSLLLESELGSIFDEDGIDIITALQEKAVIIFILNPLIYPETSQLMGRLILIDSKKAVSYLFQNKERTFFLFDEINTYASSVLIDLINKSRSACITCILATQSLSDLDYAVDENFKEQVIENCNNYILLRQNSAKNAEAWANIIGTRTNAETTYQLSDENGRTLPTGMGTLKFNKEYIFHPDDIKNLKLGEAFYVSKDTGQKLKIKIHKPF